MTDARTQQAEADQLSASGERRRLRDRAIALPLLFTAVLLPPYVGLMHAERSLGGIPLPLFYLFGGWGLAILLSARLARGLLRQDPALPFLKAHDQPALDKGGLEDQPLGGRAFDGQAPSATDPMQARPAQDGAAQDGAAQDGAAQDGASQRR